MNEWISIRHKWPKNAGKYRVKDCQFNEEGITEYDGYEFKKWRPAPITKGHMMIINYIVTHWKELD